MGGPEMAPQTPHTFGAARHSRVAPLTHPHVRSAPAQPGRSSNPPTLGAPRPSRGTARYSDRLVAPPRATDAGTGRVSPGRILPAMAEPTRAWLDGRLAAVRCW